MAVVISREIGLGRRSTQGRPWFGERRIWRRRWWCPLGVKTGHQVGNSQILLFPYPNPYFYPGYGYEYGFFGMRAREDADWIGFKSATDNLTDSVHIKKRYNFTNESVKLYYLLENYLSYLTT